MRTQHNRTKPDELLSTASGYELLMLMAMSNAGMRRQIQRELDLRAMSASATRRRSLVRPELMRAA